MDHEKHLRELAELNVPGFASTYVEDVLWALAEIDRLREEVTTIKESLETPWEKSE